MNWIEKTVSIKEIKNLLNDHLVEVTSPDGWVEVTNYIEKGEEYAYELNINNKNKILSSKNHLYETNNGWVLAKNLNINTHKILTENGIFECFNISKTNKKIKIVDITINHKNHRYYTNGVSSHNTNLGKSLIMCSLATNNLMQNKNVLYITLEMSELRIAERVMANLFDYDINEISNVEKSHFMEKFSTWNQKLKNKLMIKEFPPKAISSNHIRNLIKELKMKKKFIPEIIYLDYLSIMSSSTSNKNDNTYTEIKRISEDVRALAVELGIPIVSAVQTNRGGFGSVEIDLTDIADSIGTTATADLIIGVTQPDEFRNLNKFCWMVLKNRFGLNKKKMSVLVDYFKMRVSDDPADLNSEDMPQNPEKKKEEKVNAATEIVSNLLNKDNKDKFKKVIYFE